MATGSQGRFSWYFICPYCNAIDIVWDMSQYGEKWEDITYEEECILLCVTLEVFCDEGCRKYTKINFHKKHQNHEKETELFKRIIKEDVWIGVSIDKIYECQIFLG